MQLKIYMEDVCCDNNDKRLASSSHGDKTHPLYEINVRMSRFQHFDCILEHYSIELSPHFTI